MASPPVSREFRSMMPKDLKELLSAFNDHAVKYLIVGGYAFGVHAEPRANKDLDLFIRPDEENSQALFRALAQYGALLGGLSPADFMDGTVFQIASILPEWTFCSTSMASVSIKPGKIGSRGLSMGKSGRALYLKLTSSKINSQAEESRTFSTLRSCEPQLGKIHRTIDG
jgi:hypothetical protein